MVVSPSEEQVETDGAFCHDANVKRRNWRIIESNLREAREQLEALEADVRSSKKPSDVELAIGLEHAYHHLNFAWNARFASEQVFRQMSDGQFNVWSKYPRELKPFRITPKPLASSVKD
jgi:hypothetical protein